MAYACPVCNALAPDGEHLSHHLAIVAMTRGGEHETWLDEHAAGWEDATPEELAATAVDHADAVEHELTDESAGERPDVHDHDDGNGMEADRGRGAGAGQNAGQPGGTAGGADGSNATGDEETAAVLAEAREITRRMLGEDDDATSDAEDDEGGSDETDDADATGDDEPTETDSDE